MGGEYTTLVDEIRKQLEDRGGAHDTRSAPATDKNLQKCKQGDPKPISRESRSVQQVVNFSSPSFPS